MVVVVCSLTFAFEKAIERARWGAARVYVGAERRWQVDIVTVSDQDPAASHDLLREPIADLCERQSQSEVDARTIAPGRGRTIVRVDSGPSNIRAPVERTAVILCSYLCLHEAFASRRCMQRQR